jgi:hypothetical protein
MPSPDLNSLSQNISSKINSAKTAVEALKSQKDLQSSAANSATQGLNFITSQLDSVKNLQKRYQRDPPNSTDQLLNFLGQTRGTGQNTLKYLRKKILETSTTIQPKVVNIFKEQTMKALGCSQEQTYKGVSASDLALQPLPLRPQQEGIYIPVQSVDFFSNLKNSPTSSVGQVYYELPEPSSDTKFIPYGGDVPFPMNKQLNQLMDSSNANRSYSQINGKNYQGKSGQNLFDIQYTTTNNFGVTGDYYRVMLIDRSGSGTTTVNKVGEFISDYYSTINFVDPVNVGAQLVNILSGAMNIKAQLGSGEIQNQSEFFLVAQRILGLCFDDRREIDVSGIAKIAELDGVDQSFYKLNEIDLRNIELNLSNVQNGVMEFEDCQNVKLPVDADNLVSQLIEFRNTTGQTTQQQVNNLESILDSISQNPDWKLKLPIDFNASLAIDQNIIKKIPLAVAAGVLTPKNLLPVFALMSIVQSGATFTYNQVVTSANTFFTSANTANADISAAGANIIKNGTDFLKKWEKFSIQVISQINAEFLAVLFEILKKDIINLIASILLDIEKGKITKRYTIILRLAGLLISVGQLIKDYRQCKPLLEDILAILLSLNGLAKDTGIPISLLFLTPLLPGYSPERAFINVIEELQAIGIPTGALPDGSPPLMLLYNLATHRGSDKEKSENGKLDAAVAVTGPGIFKIVGKDR